MDSMIDTLANLIRPMAEPDRRRWDYAPLMIDQRYVITSKAGHGRYYVAAADGSFDGIVDNLKRWVTTRREWLFDTILQTSGTFFKKREREHRPFQPFALSF